MSMVQAEYSYPLICYWKYEECEEIILDAIDRQGLKCNLDGKMGRLTKFQSFDKAQLVLDIKSQDVSIRKEESKQSSKLYESYNDDCILLEQPHMVEEAPEVEGELIE